MAMVEGNNRFQDKSLRTANSISSGLYNTTGCAPIRSQNRVILSDTQVRYVYAKGAHRYYTLADRFRLNNNSLSVDSM